GRLAAVGHEPDRPGPGADLPRRRQRRLPRQPSDQFAADGLLLPAALLRIGGRDVPRSGPQDQAAASGQGDPVMMKSAVQILAGLAALGCVLIDSPAWGQPVVEAPAGAVRGETADGVN